MTGHSREGEAGGYIQSSTELLSAPQPFGFHSAAGSKPDFVSYKDLDNKNLRKFRTNKNIIILTIKIWLKKIYFQKWGTFSVFWCLKHVTNNFVI